MTSIAFPLAALLALQGATPSTGRARECEPTDNRCKAALFVRRAAAAVLPKERALYLHAAHRSYLALFDQTGEEQHLCAARKTYEQSLAVEGQPDKQRESFVALLGDLTTREAKQRVRCTRGAKGAAKASPRIAAAGGPSKFAPVAEGPAPSNSPAVAANAVTVGHATGSTDPVGATKPKMLLLEPAPTSEPATTELMPVVRGPALSDRKREAVRVDKDEHPGRRLVIAGGVTLGAGLVLAGVAGYMGGRLVDTRRQAEELLGEIDGYSSREQGARNDALERDYRRLGPPTLALALAGGASVVVAAVLLAVGGRRMSRAPSRTALIPVPGGVALHTRF